MPTRPDTTGSAADFLPPPGKRSLPQLAEAAQSCRGCDLYKRATQAVFGEGPRRAHVMMVGEQPGDQEDLAGHPFVGPAGGMLDKALAEAGIDRADIFITNAVKHFKFLPRGKRRLHAKPSAAEVRACRPWLEQEVAAVRPRIIVALGATAAQSIMGAAFRITASHGRYFDSPLGPRFVSTIHPSAVLRMPQTSQRDQAFAQLVADLSGIPAQLISAAGPAPGRESLRGDPPEGGSPRRPVRTRTQPDEDSLPGFGRSRPPRTRP